MPVGDLGENYVEAFEVWQTEDLEVYLRSVAAMFEQVEHYASDTDEGYDGWQVIFDIERTLAKDLPWLGLWFGERLDPKATAPLMREQLRDRANLLRGTLHSIQRAAQRHLIGGRTVMWKERAASGQTQSNYVLNPSFETSVDWTASPQGAWAISTDWATAGTKSAKFSGLNVTQTLLQWRYEIPQEARGRDWTLDIDFKGGTVTNVAAPIQFVAQVYCDPPPTGEPFPAPPPPPEGDMDFVNAVAPLTNVRTLSMSGHFKAPPGKIATHMIVSALVDVSPATSISLYIDNVRLALGAELDHFYVATFASETPSPSITLGDLQSVVPADLVLHYEQLSGQQWGNVKASNPKWVNVYAVKEQINRAEYGKIHRAQVAPTYDHASYENTNYLVWKAEPLNLQSQNPSGFHQVATDWASHGTRSVKFRHTGPGAGDVQKIGSQINFPFNTLGPRNFNYGMPTLAGKAWVLKFVLRLHDVSNYAPIKIDATAYRGVIGITDERGENPATPSATTTVAAVDNTTYTIELRGTLQGIPAGEVWKSMLLQIYHNVPDPTTPVDWAFAVDAIQLHFTGDIPDINVEPAFFTPIVAGTRWDTVKRTVGSPLGNAFSRPIPLDPVPVDPLAAPAPAP